MVAVMGLKETMKRKYHAVLRCARAAANAEGKSAASMVA
jgi:hypothetical protein